MTKYFYAIVNKNNGNLLLADSKLPIYWNKKVAQDFAKYHKGFVVARIPISDLNQIILQTPNP
jgi:hypothetical protein